MQLHVTRFDKDTPPHDLASYNGNNLSDRTQFLSDMGYKEKDLRFMPLQEEYWFSPFNYSCIGFRSTESFVVHFHVTSEALIFCRLSGHDASISIFNYLLESLYCKFKFVVSGKSIE